MQRKCRVKVHIMTMWLACACTVKLRRIVTTREPAAALLSNLVLTLKEVKEMQGSVLSIKDEIKIIEMFDESIIYYVYTILHAWSISWVWLGPGQHYPNFLFIRMVWNFPLAKGVQIIEVGLYSGIPLKRTPLGPKILSAVARYP